MKGGHAILADATDAEAAVFGEHVDRQLVRPVFVLAEQVGDLAFHPWLGSPNREREPRRQAIRTSPLQADADPSRRRYRVAGQRIKGCLFGCRVGPRGHLRPYAAQSATDCRAPIAALPSGAVQLPGSIPLQRILKSSWQEALTQKIVEGEATLPGA